MTNDNTNGRPKELPTLWTERLVLRPWLMADAPNVQRLAGAREIADTTLNMPHPYEDGVAEQWISTHQAAYEQGSRVPLAITLAGSGAVVGAISLMSIDTRHERAVIGYWIGKEYWGRGYCTEAAREMLRFGFERLGLNRIVGHHFARNPASGRVMRKIGMEHEGTLRQHVKRWDAFEDSECYGILKSQWSIQ